MTADEESVLADLLAKKKAEEEQAIAPVLQVEQGAPVLRIIPGGALSDPDQERVRAFVRNIENGQIEQYVLVGLTPGTHRLSMVFSHAPASFEMLGALDSVLHIQRRTVTG